MILSKVPCSFHNIGGNLAHLALKK